MNDKNITVINGYGDKETLSVIDYGNGILEFSGRNIKFLVKPEELMSLLKSMIMTPEEAERHGFISPDKEPSLPAMSNREYNDKYTVKPEPLKEGFSMSLLDNINGMTFDSWQARVKEIFCNYVGDGLSPKDVKLEVAYAENVYKGGTTAEVFADMCIGEYLKGKDIERRLKNVPCTNGGFYDARREVNGECE